MRVGVFACRLWVVFSRGNFVCFRIPCRFLLLRALLIEISYSLLIR